MFPVDGSIGACRWKAAKLKRTEKVANGAGNVNWVIAKCTGQSRYFLIHYGILAKAKKKQHYNTVNDQSANMTNGRLIKQQPEEYFRKNGICY